MCVGVCTTLLIQSSQEILNLHFLGQWHDPVLVQRSNQTWIDFVGWISFILSPPTHHLLPISSSFQFYSSFDYLFHFWVGQQNHNLITVLKKS